MFVDFHSNFCHFWSVRLNLQEERARLRSPSRGIASHLQDLVTVAPGRARLPRNNDTLSDISLQPASFAGFSGNVAFRAPSAFDSVDATVALWVWPSAMQSTDSAVILTNRQGGGCIKGIGHYGYTLSVQAADVAQRVLLHVTLGSRSDGCAVTCSSPVSFPIEMWTHVAFSITEGIESAGSCNIFLNGAAVLVAARACTLVICEVCAGERVATSSIKAGQRALQSKVALTIGSFNDGSLPFHGKLAHLAVFDALLDAAQLTAVFNVHGCFPYHS